MKIEEIRQIPVAELPERLKEERAKYQQMRLNHSISPLANPSEIKSARRTIARILTVIRENELNNQ